MLGVRFLRKENASHPHVPLELHLPGKRGSLAPTPPEPRRTMATPAPKATHAAAAALGRARLPCHGRMGARCERGGSELVGRSAGCVDLKLPWLLVELGGAFSMSPECCARPRHATRVLSPKCRSCRGRASGRSCKLQAARDCGRHKDRQPCAGELETYGSPLEPGTGTWHDASTRLTAFAGRATPTRGLGGRA